MLKVIQNMISDMYANVTALKRNMLGENFSIHLKYFSYFSK